MQDLSINNPTTIKEWDARFKAGLPVWIKTDYGEILLLKKDDLYPSDWYTDGIAEKFYISDPRSKGNVESNPKTAQEEQSMNIQELLTKLFGAAMPTDYDLRPKYQVVAYNRDESEMGQATADSVETVAEKVKSTPELWGCRVLCYKLSKEVTVDVPVSVTKATVVE